MSELVIDVNHHPTRVYLVDTFVVPLAAREEFVAAMRRNMGFIRTVRGFCGHAAFERPEGSGACRIMTIAAWEDRAALDGARQEVRAWYRQLEFDMPAALERWGVTLQRAEYDAPPALQ